MHIPVTKLVTSVCEVSSEEKYLLTNIFVRSTGGREFYVHYIQYVETTLPNVRPRWLFIKLPYVILGAWIPLNE